MIKFSTTKSKYFINTSGDNMIVYKRLFLFVFYKYKFIYKTKCVWCIIQVN